MFNLSELAKNNNMLERDLAVLDALSAGPTTLAYLHRMFFKKPDGKMLSRQSFNDYLRRMVVDEYLKVGSCSDNTKRLSRWRKRFAVLDVRGADLVCRIIPFKEREYIRMNKPSKHQFVHEMLLSEIIRNIWQEARARNTFTVEHIYDDRIYKQILTRKYGHLKGMYIPDLEVKIHPISYYRPITIRMELDSGQKTHGYWVEKVSAWDALSLVICVDPERIEYLSQHVESNKANLKGTVCFISFNDFLKSGLSYWLATLNAIGEKNKHVYLYDESHESITITNERVGSTINP